MNNTSTEWFKNYLESENIKKHFIKQRNKQILSSVEKRELYLKQYYKNPQNKERYAQNQRDWLKIPEVKQKRDSQKKKWSEENPSPGAGLTEDIQEAMLNVGIRDGFTCQWDKCKKNRRQTIIDIHHIFPKSEYPNLASIEQYMICYCRYHHYWWHFKRNDKYAKLLKPQL